MPKIKIIASIKNKTQNLKSDTTAIIQDNIIKYKEDAKTTVKYNYLDNTLVRENTELMMKYEFKTEEKTSGTVFIKDLNKEIKLIIETKELKKKGNSIEINFKVEDEEFLYKIEEIK